MAEALAAPHEVRVRPLLVEDEREADHVMRVAFGTFLGLPRPEAFMGDAAFVSSRRLADPQAAFAAEIGGELVGSNFATNWGSLGFFGPLSVRPDHWDHGVGARLMEPVMECFERWGTRHAGLFTFAHSAKHVGLYRRFGFWPRFLTFVVGKPVGAGPRTVPETFRAVAPARREAVLREARDLTDAVLEGLDLRREILALDELLLGDTVLLGGDSRLDGLAVCHTGPGSEAGGETCYVKFAAVRPGPHGARDLARLLEACEAFAAARGLARLTAGVNAAREEACRLIFERGFRTELQGVAMQRPNEPGTNRPGVFVLDDWR